jgi:hypothetical protein
VTEDDEAESFKYFFRPEILMRRISASALLLTGMLAAGCRDTNDPAHAGQLDHLLASALLVGTVVVQSDSTPVPGAKVVVLLVGSIPPDSTPPDSIPPDSIPPDSTGRGSGSPISALNFVLDSLPGDSTPPPPPARCGSRGTAVARTTTNTSGRFRIRGLAPGIYDIRAEAQGFGQGVACGVVVAADQETVVGIGLRTR